MSFQKYRLVFLFIISFFYSFVDKHVEDKSTWYFTNWVPFTGPSWSVVCTTDKSRFQSIPDDIITSYKFHSTGSAIRNNLQKVKTAIPEK